MFLSSRVAVFPDWIHDFPDCSLHKLLHSGKSHPSLASDLYPFPHWGCVERCWMLALCSERTFVGTEGSSALLSILSWASWVSRWERMPCLVDTLFLSFGQCREIKRPFFNQKSRPHCPACHSSEVSITSSGVIETYRVVPFFSDGHCSSSGLDRGLSVWWHLSTRQTLMILLLLWPVPSDFRLALTWTGARAKGNGSREKPSSMEQPPGGSDAVSLCAPCVCV